MVAAKNEVMKGAVNELYRVSSDAEVRQQYDQHERAWRNEMARDAYLEQRKDSFRAEGIKIGETKGRAEAAAQYQARIAELEAQLAAR
jgi:ABC-type Fe3+-hydroxamate transport system substrate-binding protein